MAEKFFKVSEVAKLFNVRPSTVRFWLSTGVISGVKIGTGHYWRIPASEVDRLGTQRHGRN